MYDQAKLLGLTLALASLAGGASAQTQHFRHYTGVDGLPQAQVQVVHQDQRGFIWAGTFGGLGRFDGRSFSQFSTADGLSSNAVQALASEPDGTLWAGQSSGLCVLRPGQVRFECPDLPGIVDGNVRALLVGPDALWAGTRGGLYAIRRYRDGRYRARQVLKGDVYAIAWAGPRRLWVGGTAGLWEMPVGGTPRPVTLPLAGAEVQALQMDGPRLWIGTKSGLLLREGTTVSVPASLPAPLRSLNITGLALGPDGLLWAATRRGLLHQRKDGFELFQRDDGLSEEDLTSVMRDREGNVWFGGDGGLTSYVDAAFVGYDERNGLWKDFVRAVAEDAKGRLWLGTREGVQVVRVEADGRMVEQFRIDKADGLVDERIYNIRFQDGQAWIATGHGVAVWREGEGIVRLYTKADGLPDNGTRVVHPLHDGSLAISTSAGVAVLRDGKITPAPQPELAAAQIIHITEDRAGRVWFGSMQKGAYVLERDGRVHHLTAANGLSDQNVWQTAPDASGGVWIGTNGDGLFHRTRDGRLTRYTTRDGLIDNFIWQVLVDRDGVVWCFTNRGLSRFDGRDFSNFGTDDGLLDQEGAATATLQTAAGVRWFASGKGLMRYVDSGRKAALLAPEAAIQGVLAGGRPMRPGDTLGPDARNLEFHFAAPLFRRNSDLLYRYRLLGAGDEWRELRGYHPISYANLGAGEYTFEVQARRTSQPWPSVSATFPFHINPPFWRTAPFLFTLGLALAAAAWMVAHFRLRAIEAGRRALEALVRERTDALESANRQLEHASFTDPLTELRNRRYMAHQIDSDVAQVVRAYAGAAHPVNADMAFVMVDIDHFKSINDRYGHAAGDRVLRTYAQVIGSVIRDSDYAVRWGGEEFLLVARHADAQQCEALAERLVERVRGTEFVIDDAGTVIRSTCSVGLSHFPFVPGCPQALHWSQVIDVCDAAVYLVKAGGRDGWVALHGAPGCTIADQAGFMKALKQDPFALVEEGTVLLSGTRCPVVSAA